MKGHNIAGRLFIGAGAGILHGYLIMLLVNLGMKNQDYMPVLPSLTERIGSEMNAVLLQTALTGLLGIAFAISTLFYEVKSWSFLAQTLAHFAVTGAVMTPVIILCWLPDNVFGVISLVCGVLGGYIINFVIQKSIDRKNIDQVNKCFEAMNREEEQ